MSHRVDRAMPDRECGAGRRVPLPILGPLSGHGDLRPPRGQSADVPATAFGGPRARPGRSKRTADARRAWQRQRSVLSPELSGAIAVHSSRHRIQRLLRPGHLFRRALPQTGLSHCRHALADELEFWAGGQPKRRAGIRAGRRPRFVRRHATDPRSPRDLLQGGADAYGVDRGQPRRSRGRLSQPHRCRRAEDRDRHLSADEPAPGSELRAEESRRVERAVDEVWTRRIPGARGPRARHCRRVLDGGPQ